VVEEVISKGKIIDLRTKFFTRIIDLRTKFWEKS
jgi:hypothetical protein